MFVAQLFEQVKYALDVGAGQGGRRLVENEQAGIFAQCLGNLDHLPARQRQVANPLARVDILAADACQQLFCSAPLRFAVEQAAASARLSNGDIFLHRQRGQQGKLLKNTDDAGVVGLDGVGEAHRCIAQKDVSGIGLDDAGDNLDERAFARAVFAEDGVDRARRTAKVYAVECGYAAVALGDAAQA